MPKYVAAGFSLRSALTVSPGRLSGNWDRNEEGGGRDQIFMDLRDNSGPIALKPGDIWAVIPLSAVDSQFSDSLPGSTRAEASAGDSSALSLTGDVIIFDSFDRLYLRRNTKKGQHPRMDGSLFCILLLLC